MENNNGKGIFYGVIGVATLIVAIIGATFAYFSASATSDADITGQTLDIAGDFSLSVKRVNKSETVASDDLVPSDLTADTTVIGNALEAQCVDAGYTGCHVYNITASSGQTLDTASIKLTLDTELNTTNSEAVTDWKYVLYTGTDSTITSLVEGGNGSFNLETAFDMHKGATITGGTPVTYYLMVYIANDANNAQDAGDTKDVTGTYSGTVSMTAAGGAEVSATFSSQA